MSDKMIKRLILWIPTITIGLWEYVRHSFLLPYLSMDMGNILAPVIVFIVSATLLTRLFKLLDDTQATLRREQQTKAALEERERLAQELHDGISQSLFMLSVKIDRLEAASTEEKRDQLDKLRQTVRHVYDDVRQAIANLRTAPQEADFSWSLQLMHMIEDSKKDTEWQVEVRWNLPEEALSIKEKIALFSCVREALTNVRKHADAQTVQVIGEQSPGGFYCEVRDDGVGFSSDPFAESGKYGLKMLRDRTRNMGWSLHVERVAQQTVLRVCKESRPEA
ncbi:sensor histidine kinase [Paenibacillus apiarius]|uniref:histidine kinase n=1 Tax=Paenibacillus apiarius TaxID=46240 RepID=A0ABT4DUB7_9BACL|nr:histidine kinase [Paenibacillus apiarius]MCY9516729.1 histidine kinase [Paenibacillus apiarius]MCY9519873.1 histidine kinase [Paenibacillus apiarius]MCY9553889.1 histidine kinase [Paenibacillus apiarius]MCY9557503.1 histidine kinase [Paenibacillus apiarius]MCY9685463.1 histidine kinase [Paenibacillus apiarius]